MTVPDRADIVWLDFNPQSGHEQAGLRPALVLSPKEYNRKSGLAVFAPLTSKVKGYPYEVTLPPGLPFHGVVLADQVRSLDWRHRRAKSFGRVPEEVVDDVVARLNTLITPD